MEAFLLGRDLHSDTAAKVFGLEYECFEDKTFSKYDEYRNTYRSPAKNMNFGIVYGISSIGLAVMIKQSEDEAQRMIDKYYDTYGMMKDWLENSARSAQKTLQARTMSGRMQKFNPPTIDADTGRPIGLGLIGRNGRNMPVQGTGADILKRAAKLVSDRLKGYDARIVNLIHDEILVESHVSVANTVKDIIEEEMVRAATEFITRVPIIAEAKIIKTWSGKDNKEEPIQL
jgi:DNA polymerase-1